LREQSERLLDILEAIERIEKYASQGREAFSQDELIQVWIVHHLQIIGEAAQSLDSKLKEAFPEIPWAKVIGMRNILVHQYFGIDTEIVWAVVQDELSTLKDRVKAMLMASEG
jgi:uncharacterized protein with HEPN domain